MPYELIKDFKLLGERDIGPALFRVYENRIYHVIIKKGEKVSMEVVQEGYIFLEEHGGGQFYNIYQFESFSDADPEVREWAASPSNNSYTHVDAIVFNSFPQKIIADFYVRFNKPIKPTKIFKSLDNALIWVNEMMNEK
jgi:hypothetical protein